MKISDLIVSLTALSAEHGELTVLAYDRCYYVEAQRVETTYENLWDETSKKFKQTLCVRVE